MNSFIHRCENTLDSIECCEFADSLGQLTIDEKHMVWQSVSYAANTDKV